MHIENDKLVGSYVSEVYPENGAVTIIIVDGDSTPTREFTRYKYVQTPQLTEIGVAVKDYGCVIIPFNVINMITNNEIDGKDFGVVVNFNGAEYGISISDIIALVPNDTIEFSLVEEDTFIGATFGAEIPPFNSEDVDSVLKVVDGKLQWVKVEEPETYYISALISGNFVVCYPNTTTPVPYNKFDRGLPIRLTNNGEETTIMYPCGLAGSFTYASPASSDGTIDVQGYIGDIVNNIVKRDNYATLKCVPSFGTTDKYKVLSVNSSGNGIEWKTLTKELPTISAGDAGKVLKVNAGETGVEWGAAGEGGIPVIDASTIPPRIETVDGVQYDSSTDGLILSIGGNDTLLPAGTYFFVDEIPQTPFILKITDSYQITYAFPIYVSNVTIVNPTPGMSGIYLKNGTAYDYVYCIPNSGADFALIPSTAELGYHDR